MPLKIPPPLLFLAFAFLVYTLPNYAHWQPYSRPMALPLALLAMGIDLLGIWAFWQKKTTINPLAPNKTRQLVCHGVYRFSRNPMYLGLILWLSAWALWLAAPLGIFGVLGLKWLLERYQIQPEEQILQAKFGENYLAYQRQVPRWISLKPLKCR